MANGKNENSSVTSKICLEKAWSLLNNFHNIYCFSKWTWRLVFYVYTKYTSWIKIFLEKYEKKYAFGACNFRSKIYQSHQFMQFQQHNKGNMWTGSRLLPSILRYTTGKMQQFLAKF